MSTLSVTNITTGSNTTALTLGTLSANGATIKLEAANSTVNFQNVAINGTAISSFMHTYKNKIINGDFNVWQRGTSSTSNGYLADRWYATSTGTTKTVSRQTFTVGQTSVPGEPIWYYRHVVTSSAGSSNLCQFMQKIEDVRTLAGQVVTLSFWAKADASRNIAVELFQAFGSGGSPSSSVSTPIGLTALTSSWQKFSITITIPSISGKTIGSNGDHYMTFIIWLDAGSSLNTRASSLGQQSGTFDFSRFQLELGPVATAWDDRQRNIEIPLCQRYYEKSYNVETDPGTATYVGCVQHLMYVTNSYGTPDTVKFSTRKKGTPSVTLYSPQTGTSGKIYHSSDAGDKNGGTQNEGETGFGSFINNVSSGTGAIYLHWIADAEL